MRRPHRLAARAARSSTNPSVCLPTCPSLCPSLARHTTALLREVVRDHKLPERLEECAPALLGPRALDCSLRAFFPHEHLSLTRCALPVSVSTFDLKSLSVRTHRSGDLAAVVSASFAVPGTAMDRVAVARANSHRE